MNNDTEREAFEAWAREDNPDWNLAVDVWAHTAWRAWQARASTPAPAGEQREAIRELQAQLGDAHENYGRNDERTMAARRELNAAIDRLAALSAPVGQREAREPLTEEQIDEAIQHHVDPVATYRKLHDFARAIERAHGIGAGQEGESHE